MEISRNDVAVLREVAQKYMSYASLPAQLERRNQWAALNGGHLVKPMVTIEQLPWHELEPADEFLTCKVEDPYFRDVERALRRLIYKWEHLPVDMVLEPVIALPRPIKDGRWGMRSIAIERGSSVCYVDQLEEEEDLVKIQTPKVTLDFAYEAELRETAESIFAGIAPVRMAGTILHLGLWDFISFYRGVETCYIDLLDRPEHVHAILERMTQAVESEIDQINALRAYDANAPICHCSHVYEGEGGFAWQEGGTTQESWAFSMAQLFTSVSPEINAEFEVPYMTRLFSRFKNIYYGCCERLDDRLDIIDRMPNIRKISCSPWSDREHFAAILPKKYIMSNKPSPSYLATESFDEEVVRQDIRRTVNAARANGVRLELLLKDVSTVRNDPARLWRWAEIAAEETAR